MSDEQLTAISIPIKQIRPDPTQPRRLLPCDLVEAFASGISPSDILAQLRERGKRQRWVRERAAELEALADSIATDGLMQPIRVFQDGDDAYRIEAGERRWWAHQILLGRGDSRFETIAAFVIQPEVEDKGILRRRVAENVHRSGFTAIELARAMATRAEEIATAEPTLSRREIDRRVRKRKRDVGSPRAPIPGNFEIARRGAGDRATGTSHRKAAARTRHNQRPCASNRRRAVPWLIRNKSRRYRV